MAERGLGGGESEPKARQRRTSLVEGNREGCRRRGGAAGNPVGAARDAGQQERGGATPQGRLQNAASQGEALQHRGRRVPRVLIRLRAISAKGMTSLDRLTWVT